MFRRLVWEFEGTGFFFSFVVDVCDSGVEVGNGCVKFRDLDKV